jgi:hypothetical protein
VLYFPVSVFVPFSIPQVGSTFFGSGFRFRLPFYGFIKVHHASIMVDIEERSASTSSEGALAYLIEFVFPKDQAILLSFFKYNGIEDFKDIMSFNKLDFN